MKSSELATYLDMYPPDSLQSTFLTLFAKTFPEMALKMVFRDGMIELENLCFAVSSESEEFGALTFDISANTITIFSEFHHCHFETYVHPNRLTQPEKINLTCQQALENFRNYIEGDIIIEFKEIEGDILASRQLFKRDQAEFSFFMWLHDRLFRLFRNKDVDIRMMKTRRINWFGEIK